MNRGRRLSYGGLLLGWLILQPTPTLAAEQPITLDIIRAALRDYYTSIHSVSAKYRQWYTPAEDSPFSSSQAPYEGRAWGPQRWEWAEKGAQKLLVSDAIPLPEYSGTHYWASFDGRQAYFVDYDPENPGQVRSIIRQRELEFGYSHRLRPAHFLGLPVWRAERPLSELLGRDARLEGLEDLDGSACWKIDAGVLTAPHGSRYHLTVWVDPKRDFLPRKFRLTDPGGGPSENELIKASGREWFDELEMREFVRVHDRSTRVERWFPKEGLFRTLDGTDRIVVDEVTLNAPLAASRFVPQMPFGTMVLDGRQLPGKPPRAFIVGGSKAVEAKMKQRLQEAQRLAYPASPGALLVDARERSGFPASHALFWGSLAILVVALVWRIKSRSALI